MIRFLADENFDNVILRGLQRRIPEVEIVRAQDTVLAAQPDPLVLEWAVEHGYMVLTHDVNTMRGFFYERLNAGLPVPGVFLVRKQQNVGDIVEALELIVLASEPEEWQGAIHFLPQAY